VRERFWAIAIVGLALASAACSVRKLAVHSMGDALAEGRAVYGRDDDPDLVREATPFALKTAESLLEAAPRHPGLLLAAASGFTQYASAFVQQEADFAEERDLGQARALRARAHRLYLRARDYGFRGLEVDIPGFRQRLRDDPQAVLAKTRRSQAPFLYWTALAWAGAMSLAKDDAELSADQGLAESMMRRALALDEGFDRGSIHDFFIAWEGAHAATGGSFPRAGQHLERALALAEGQRAAPLVIYAETVAVARQDRAEFERRLGQALDVDPDRTGEWRLSNLLYQKRARWLLSRSKELFVE
jgi:predicted anti-sigma-YlaC factor YlaD